MIDRKRNLIINFFYYNYGLVALLGLSIGFTLNNCESNKTIQMQKKIIYDAYQLLEDYNSLANKQKKLLDEYADLIGEQNKKPEMPSSPELSKHRI